MFWFWLAKQLKMSVRRCQQEVDSPEFAEWVAISNMNAPIDEQSKLKNPLNIEKSLEAIYGGH